MKQETKATSGYKNMRNVTFVLMLGILVYHLFPFPPVAWRTGLVAISIMGLIYHLRDFKLSFVEKAMMGFILINIAYFFISMLWQVPESTNFGNVLCATLPLFLFYVLSAHGVITQRSLTIFLILSTLLGYFYFTHAESVILEKVMNGESGEITVNASTIFLVIIPLLFFLKNRWLTITIMAVIMFFVIFGAKRGNIVSMIIPFYLLFRMNMSSKRSLVSEMIIVFGFIALSVFAYNVMIKSDYLMGRIEKTMEGDSSGRDVIYSAAFNTWYNAEHLYNVVLGFGTDGTRKMLGIRAHNDWLEILVDFGLIGIFFYLSFFTSLIKKAWQNKNNRRAFYTLLAVFVIWFSKSLYSMGFTEDLFCYLSMVIGIVLGDLSRPNQQRVLLNI